MREMLNNVVETPNTAVSVDALGNVTDSTDVKIT